MFLGSGGGLSAVPLVRGSPAGRPTSFRPGGLSRVGPNRRRVRRVALVCVVVVSLAGAAGASAGGISDEPCPNLRGEHTNTCPSGTVGVGYALRFVESEGSGCGPGRQTFHFDSGLLPPGLTLSAAGLLSGTASQTGRFQFYVEMREPQDDPASCAGKRTQKQFTLTIRKQPWVTSTPAPPVSEVGRPFRLRLRARGGSGRFVWERAAGTLPTGLKLRDDGAIEGTPRRAGTYRFVTRSTDTEGRSLRWPVSLVVAAPLVARSQRLPVAKVGRFYSANLTAKGGVGATRWKLKRGRLPDGIRLAPRLGRLTGHPQGDWHAPPHGRSQRRTQGQVHKHPRHHHHRTTPHNG